MMAPKVATEMTPEEEEVLRQIQAHKPQFLFTLRGPDPKRAFRYSLDMVITYIWARGTVTMHCRFLTHDHLLGFHEALEFENYTSCGSTNVRGEAKIWSWGGE